MLPGNRKVVKMEEGFKYLRKDEDEGSPETVDSAGCLPDFSIHTWTVLIAEQHRCVSLARS